MDHNNPFHLEIFSSKSSPVRNARLVIFEFDPDNGARSVRDIIETDETERGLKFLRKYAKDNDPEPLRSHRDFKKLWDSKSVMDRDYEELRSNREEWLNVMYEDTVKMIEQLTMDERQGIFGETRIADCLHQHVFNITQLYAKAKTERSDWWLKLSNEIADMAVERYKAPMDAAAFWEDYMRKHPHAPGPEVMQAYEHYLVQTGQLIPVSKDGKRVFIDGVGDCAIDFDHKLD